MKLPPKPKVGRSWALTGKVRKALLSAADVRASWKVMASCAGIATSTLMRYRAIAMEARAYMAAVAKRDGVPIEHVEPPKGAAPFLELLDEIERRRDKVTKAVQSNFIKKAKTGSFTAALAYLERVERKEWAPAKQSMDVTGEGLAPAVQVFLPQLGDEAGKCGEVGGRHSD